MRIYLDVCCLNRPLDDQRQERIRLESEAVLLILELCVRGRYDWVAGEVIEEEVQRNPDEYKRAMVMGLLSTAPVRALVTPDMVALARSLVAFGLREIDTLHLAAAQSERCEVLLTTDDDFLRRAKRLGDRIDTRVENPTRWILEIIET